MGKTSSARTYAVARWATDRFVRSAVVPPALLASRTAMLSPGVTTTLRELETSCSIGALLSRPTSPEPRGQTCVA